MAFSLILHGFCTLLEAISVVLGGLYSLKSAFERPALPRKPLPERLVRLGHCMLVPALGSGKTDEEREG